MPSSKVIIRGIEQTCLFIQEGDFLKNLVKMKITNDNGPTYADLLIFSETETYKIPLGLLKMGENTYDIYVPDLRKNSRINFSICDSCGNTLASASIDWKPKKHWTIFLVQFSHHDLGYTDLPQNVLNEYTAFYDLIMQYCEETKNWPEEVKFRYQVEQLWSFLNYLRSQSKDKIESILDLIRNGRIGISALFGNEITGLMGHEEIVRLLYPAFYLKKAYNIPIKIAELNDVPGLSWGLATILSNCGINIIAPLLPRWYYGHYTPFWDEEKVTSRKEPVVFWWESLDGKKVLFWYQSMGFGGDVGFNEGYNKVFENLPRFLEKLEEGYSFNAVPIRLPGGARDNSPPSLRQCMVAKEWNSRWAYPRIVISTLDQFFDHLEKNFPNMLNEMPTFRGELPDSDYPVGATSTMQATIINRNAHDLIPAAEKFAVIADKLFGLQYPWKTYIERAYEHNILYDEHTWGLCCPLGPAQEASRIEKVLHAFKAYSLAQDVLVKSINRIADEINMPEKGCYIIIFNSLPWTRTDIVRAQLMEPDPCGHPMFEAEIDITKHITLLLSSHIIGRKAYYPPAELFKKNFRIIDLESGRKATHQIIAVKDSTAPILFAADRVGAGSYEGRFAQEILFIAEDVPPLGYKVYRIEEVSEQIFLQDEEADEAREIVIENEFYRVKVDPKSGIIKSIYDRKIGRDLLDENASHSFGQIIIRETATSKEYSMENIRVRRGFNGPVINSIIIEGSALGFPLITEEIVLYNGIKKLDLNVRILKDSTALLELYVAFPFRINKPCFTYEGPNIVVTPPKDQFPGSHTCYYPIQHWVNVYDELDDFGITLSSVDAHLVMLGGLWPLGVSFAHHGITPPGYPSEKLRVKEFKKGYIYSFVLTNNFRTNFYMTQIGDMLLRFSLTSHEGDWRNLTAVQHGWNAMNHLISIFTEGGNKGVLPMKATSFCKINPSSVIITALKCSEEGDLVLRLWETLGRKTDTEVVLPYLTIKEALLTNLVEEEMKEKEDIKVINSNTVLLTLKPFEIKTIKLKCISKI
jgi:hypothetical protein